MYDNNENLDNSIEKIDDAKISKIFTSESERLVAILGNNYVQNYINNGNISNGFAVVSNRRCYFNGESFEVITNRRGKRKVIKTRRSRIVDLKDITGTGYDNHENFILKVIFFILFLLSAFSILLVLSANLSANILALSLPIILISILFGFLYLKSRNTFVTIQFNGGEVAFPIKWFGTYELDKFQKDLRNAKDSNEEESEDRLVGKLNQSTIQNNTGTLNCISADELLKYAKLVNDGIITQEEFDKIKQKLI